MRKRIAAEQVRRDDDAEDADRLFTVEREVLLEMHGDVLERCALSADVPHVRVGDAGVVPIVQELGRVRAVQGDDAVRRLAERQRAEEETVDEAEDHGGRPDAEREGQERRRGEPGALTSERKAS